MAEPFVETYLNVEIPLVKPAAPYTRWGDVFGVFFAAAAAAVLLTGIIRAILRLAIHLAQKSSGGLLGVKSTDGTKNRRGL
jgi:hypothetical protein